MMLKETIEKDLKEAMLAKDRVRIRTIRSLRAALLEKEIELREGGEANLSDELVLSVIQKQAKQRRDSLEQFVNAKRDDLAQTEREELDIIGGYLPEQLTEEDVRKEVQSAIDNFQASSMKDIGRVMGPVMKRLKGQVDGRLVQKVVKELLST